MTKKIEVTDDNFGETLIESANQALDHAFLVSEKASISKENKELRNTLWDVLATIEEMKRTIESMLCSDEK